MTTEEISKIHPLIRLIKYIENNPEKRKLELNGRQVWLRSEYGMSCVYAPGFDDIIAPTSDNLEPLF